LAVVDYTTVFYNTSGTIDVLLNDLLGNCTHNAITVAVTTQPTHSNGPATVNADNNIVYTPATDFVGKDSLTYTITCGSNSSSAKVYYTVTEKPDNIIDADCYTNPIGTTFNIRELPQSRLINEVDPYFIPIVGDVDDDGAAEILVLSANGYSCLTSR
jgi:hypothetical protein